MPVLEFILFLIIGFGGGFIGYRLKLPVGSMIGAMLAVALAKTLGVLTLQSHSGLSIFLQICLGTMLGVSFIDLQKKQIKKIAVALIVLTVGLTVMVSMIVCILSVVTDLSLPITILSASPGALYEVAMLAKVIEEDAPAVVLLHLARITIIMSLFPVVLKKIIHLLEKREKDDAKSC